MEESATCVKDSDMPTYDSNQRPQEHVVTADGVRPDPSKTHKIKSYPQPTDATGVQRTGVLLQEASIASPYPEECYDREFIHQACSSLALDANSRMQAL